MSPDLAILYEHPRWFEPLFAALERAGISYVAMRPDEVEFDPAGLPPPAPLVLNRIAMSSFLRDDEHPLNHALALLDHWQRGGARVVNGPDVMAIDLSKARQLSLLAALGLATPRTRIVHRLADLSAAADRIGYPCLVKANVGGSGAGIMRFDGAAELAAVVAAGDTPRSVDRVLLVQEMISAKDGVIWRIETLGGRFLYALEIAGAGAFDLCPADACTEDRGPLAMRAFTPPAAIVEGAERAAQAMALDVGGIEVMLDEADDRACFYDINALSNFVGRPMEVLGWDPHDRLIDWLKDRIREARA